MSGQQYLVFCKNCDEVVEDIQGHDVDLSACDQCSRDAMDDRPHVYTCGWDECEYYDRIREHCMKGHDVVRVPNPY